MIENSNSMVHFTKAFGWTLFSAFSFIATIAAVQGFLTGTTTDLIVQSYANGSSNRAQTEEALRALSTPSKIQTNKPFMSLPITVTGAAPSAASSGDNANANTPAKPTLLQGKVEAVADMPEYYTITGATQGNVAPNDASSGATAVAKPGIIQQKIYVDKGESWLAGKQGINNPSNLVSGLQPRALANFKKQAGVKYNSINVMTSEKDDCPSGDGKTECPLSGANGRTRYDVCVKGRNAHTAYKRDLDTAHNANIEAMVRNDILDGYEGTAIPTAVDQMFADTALMGQRPTTVPDIGPILQTAETLKADAAAFNVGAAQTAGQGGQTSFMNFVSQVGGLEMHDQAGAQDGTILTKIDRLLQDFTCHDPSGAPQKLNNTRRAGRAEQILQRVLKDFVAQGIVVDRQNAKITLKTLGRLTPSLNTTLRSNGSGSFQRWANRSGGFNPENCRADSEQLLTHVTENLSKWMNVYVNNSDTFKKNLAKFLLSSGANELVADHVLTMDGSDLRAAFHKSNKVNLDSTGITKVLGAFTFGGDTRLETNASSINLISTREITDPGSIKSMLLRYCPPGSYLHAHTNTWTEVSDSLGREWGGSYLRHGLIPALDLLRNNNRIGGLSFGALTVVSGYKAYDNWRKFLLGDDYIEQAQDLVRSQPEAEDEIETTRDTRESSKPQVAPAATPGFFGRTMGRLRAAAGSTPGLIVISLGVTTLAAFGVGYGASVGNKLCLDILKTVKLDNFMRRTFTF